MKGAIRTALTGPDNASVDIGRVLWAIAVLALIGLEAFAVVAHRKPFDPVAFAAGAAAILAAGGFGVSVKAHAEPGAGS